MSDDALAIPAWARKYDVECQMCHSPVFARLNEYGERFLAAGYQNPDDAVPDGDKTGKTAIGSNLYLDPNLGHWLTARLNLTPVQYQTNGQTIEGETKDKFTIGNANWLQLFVAGSITQNTSVYIENELAPDGFHQAWYYMGFHNLANTTWLNFQVGRLSPVVFAPYQDRLPQLPPIGGGVMRVKSADGKGDLALNLRDPRFGIQWYGHEGSVTAYAGVTPGASKSSNPANKLGYWAGLRLWMPKSGPASLAGSSVGLHFDGGTDTKDASTTMVEDTYSRIMPSVNVRYRDRVDLQAAVVMAKDDNWTFNATKDDELKYRGVRAVGSYFINPEWIVSFHYDNYSSDFIEGKTKKSLADYHYLYAPVFTYLWRQNFRISLYPGIDLQSVDKDLKKHVLLLNIRTVF